MLKLINIKKTDNIIEADYIPESSQQKAHVSLNVSTNEISVETIEDFGSMYERMAINGLKRTIEELNNGKINKVPEERVVMWY
ncbi:MAG: hypothetical protein NC485_13235 [Ruminococcus flavefaciens]|nr:hypothetical protein [Ruminococcus flavefaciens]MCM1060581.1 hypothetical protein [Eubacterium sp.]